jgi:hypothetical protein
MKPLATRHSPLITGRRPAAFTLIELLVVIAIIAILAGLGFPAVQGALGQGKKAQARNDVQQIVAALKAFQLEYGRLPTTIVAADNSAEGGSGFFDENSKDIIKALMGADPTLNPRNIVFLDAKTTANKKGGVDLSDYTFYDPWGERYRLKLDVSYDGKCEYYGPGNKENIFGAGAAISYGPNKKKEDPYASGSDEIVSFK